MWKHFETYRCSVNTRLGDDDDDDDDRDGDPVVYNQDSFTSSTCLAPLIESFSLISLS